MTKQIDFDSRQFSYGTVFLMCGWWYNVCSILQWSPLCYIFCSSLSICLQVEFAICALIIITAKWKWPKASTSSVVQQQVAGFQEIPPLYNDRIFVSAFVHWQEWVLHGVWPMHTFMRRSYSCRLCHTVSIAAVCVIACVRFMID